MNVVEIEKEKDEALLNLSFKQGISCEAIIIMAIDMYILSLGKSEYSKYIPGDNDSATDRLGSLSNIQKVQYP
jgi:hypothetical protein